MNNTMQLYIDDDRKIKGYPITSPDRVIDENGKNIKAYLTDNVKFNIVEGGGEVPPFENGNSGGSGNSSNNSELNEEIKILKNQLQNFKTNTNNEISNLKSVKANETDGTRLTTNKTVTGAINELFGKIKDEIIIKNDEGVNYYLKMDNEGLYLKDSEGHIIRVGGNQNIISNNGTTFEPYMNVNINWSEIPSVTIPSSFTQGRAVVLNDEIHVVGIDSNTHYKWNGRTWTKVSTLPYSLDHGRVVVLNNEIHILGLASSSGVTDRVNHYKLNGDRWDKISTPLPYSFYAGCAVVLNNEIHILGSSINEHYKWDGNQWTKVSKLPDNFSRGCAVVLNNEIHILGNATLHYKWDGEQWVRMSYLPCPLANGQSVVIGNEIHIFGGNDTSSPLNSGTTNHYKWDGSQWINVSTLPCNVTGGTAIINLKNNKLIIFKSKVYSSDIQYDLAYRIKNQ